MKILQNIWVAGMLLLGMCACNDDEVSMAPAVSFKETAISVEENAKELKIPLTLTGTLEKTGWVFVSITEGSEKGGERGINYTVPAYISLGEDAVRGNYTITIIDDEYPNDNRSFVLEITNVTGGAVKGVGNQTCAVTIVDDDSKQYVTVGFDSTRMEVNEDVAIFEIPVSVKGLLSDSLFFEVVAIDGTAVSGVDFEVLESRIKVIERESWAAVPVRIKDGGAQKDDRTFKLEIRGVEGANEQDTMVAVRTNAAECEVTIKKVIRELRFKETDLRVREGMKPFEFPIVLTAPIAQDVNVTIAVKEGGTAVEGEHFTIDKKEFVIKRGETTANALITIPNDRVGRSIRSCEFEIVSLTEGVNLSETAKVARMTIEDDDSSIGFRAPAYGLFSYQTALVPVVLSGVKGSRVVITVASKPNSQIQENVHYLIMNKKLEIQEGDSVAYLQVATLCGNGVEEFNFGLEITSVKGLTLGSNVVLEDAAKECNMDVVKLGDIDRSNWEIAYTSTEEPAEGANGGLAKHLIDNNEKTFWHSKWTGEVVPGPHTIIIDMKKWTVVKNLTLRFRRKDADAVTFYFSDDQQSWTQAGVLKNPVEDNTEMPALVTLEAPIGTSGRYVKLLIDSQSGGLAALRELYMQGKEVSE